MVEQHPPANDLAAARPFQFSLRQLLMAIFLICLFLAVYLSLGIGGISWLVLLGFIVIGIRRRNYLLAFGPLGVCFVLNLMLPVCSFPQHVARRLVCQQNLRDIGAALEHYHDARGRFPPAFIADENGKPKHSWRVLILPYLGEQALYDQYDFSEPWDGPNNSKLAAKMPRQYSCPDDQAAKKSGSTNYLAVVGPGTAWPGAKPANLKDIFDKNYNTILVVEVAGQNISWMEPRDLDFVTFDAKINSKISPSISSRHSNGAQVLFANGSVQFLANDTSPAELRAMLAPPEDAK